jgi:hypothetical protein
MKKIFLLLLIALSVVSCSKKSEVSSSGYTNKLAFGTGLNPSNLFELVGVGTSFPVSGLIWFRLESADDMAGSKVRIQIKNSSGILFESPPDFDNSQSYGHIFLSAFSGPSVAGSYTATGILVTGNKTIATLNFTMY